MKVKKNQEMEQHRDHSETWPAVKSTQGHRQEEHKEDLKIHKTVGNLQDLSERGQHKEYSKLLETKENTEGKGESGENSFKRSDLSISHPFISTNFDTNLHSDNNFYTDEKLMKTAHVVIQRRSLEKMIQEAKENLGMCIKIPKILKVKRNSMLDTKKLKDLFSLSDSNKPDLIKPSMLRSNKECVVVNPLSVEEDNHCEPRASSTPDILRCLEKKEGEKRNLTDVGEANNCQATSGILMKEAPGNEMPNSMIKRQKTAVGENCSILAEKEKTAVGENCSILAEKEKKDGNIVSKGDTKECGDNPPSLENTTESYSANQKKEQPLLTTDLDNYLCSEQAQGVKDKGLCTIAKQASELKKDVSLVSDSIQTLGLEKDQGLFFHPKHRWKLAYDRQMLISNDGNLLHTTAQNTDLQHQHEKQYSGSEVTPSKKRKLKCEWFEAMENSSKRSHWIDLPTTKEYLDESGSQMKGASAIMARSSLVASIDDTSAGKLRSEDSRSETIHTGEDIEVLGSSTEQDRSKHQQQASEGEYMCLQHSESSLRERESQESHPSGQCSVSQDCQHDFPHSCQGPGQPQLTESQTDLMDNCTPYPSLVKGIACETDFSIKPKLPLKTEKVPDLICSKGDEAEPCEGQALEDPASLHQKGNTWLKECNKTKESQEQNTDCDSTSVACAFSEVFPRMNSSHGEQHVPQSKQDSADHNVVSVFVTDVKTPPRGHSPNGEKYEYIRKNNSLQALLMGRSQMSETDLPCPKALASRIKSNLKNCMLRVHSSLRDDPQGSKHECLPVMQASVTTFFLMTQNTTQQPTQSTTQKSVSTEKKSLGIKRVLFERILKKMKLQLLKDASMKNNMDQSYISSGLKKLSTFIESQGASSLQVTAVPDTQHTPVMKDDGKSHHLSPHVAKSLITQEVAELNHPYKINNVQLLYLATCRTQVSDLHHEKILQSSQEQEMATSSDVTIHSIPPKTAPYCLPVPLNNCLPQETPLPSAASDGTCTQPDHSKDPVGIERAVFVPNELYQPLWKDMPLQAPLNWKEDSKYIHLFQGKQQDVIKLKCLLVARKKSYGTLKEVEFYGGHVLVHHTVLDQLLASPDLPQLRASSFVSFGVYRSLGQVLEGKVPVALANKCLLLVHHTALLDPNTGVVLQSVSSSGLHLALVPAQTLYMCAYLLGWQLRTAADEKLKETLTQNLVHFKKCVEMGVGHILGGSRGSACAILSPQSPISEYLVCLRTIHRCLDFAHRHTAVVVGEGVEKVSSCHQPSIYRLCAAREVLQELLKVTS
ncbi:uncharacterized protein LOC123499221 [Portunus trituberculatus]|nr:uncharacterized protein LOC123499221 [Portunus trituberculatus]